MVLDNHADGLMHKAIGLVLLRHTLASSNRVDK